MDKCGCLVFPTVWQKKADNINPTKVESSFCNLTFLKNLFGTEDTASLHKFSLIYSCVLRFLLLSVERQSMLSSFLQYIILFRLPPCFIILSLWQVYERWESFKVNDTLEVYGILSVDPVLSIVNNEER